MSLARITLMAFDLRCHYSLGTGVLAGASCRLELSSAPPRNDQAHVPMACRAPHPARWRAHALARLALGAQ